MYSPEGNFPISLWLRAEHGTEVEYRGDVRGGLSLGLLEASHSP